MRLFTLWLAVLLGGVLLPWLVPFQAAMSTQVVLGAAVGVTLWWVWDQRGHAPVVRWLRDPRQQATPNGSDVWSELAYLADKALRRERQALAQLEAQHQGWLEALASAPLGLIRLDEEGHVVWMNPAASEHWSLNPQRDLGQRLAHLVRVPHMVHALQAPWREGQESVVAVDLRGRGLGPVERLEAHVADHGQGHRLVISRDVSEAQRQETMRRDFVAHVSHEIRTPLTVLVGFIDSLQNMDLAEAERRHVLGLMSQQADRMQALVSDLLTLAQLEGSPPPPLGEVVAAQDLAQQVVADAQALSAGRHEVRLDWQGPPAEILGSQRELLSAWGNLAHNAVRYTPPGGMVTVRWRWLSDGRALLEVQDTGPGIAKEHWPRLAERFYRVDSGRSRETGGTGLGLAIVKHAIQRHGGEWRVDSRLGQGSVFGLVLPARRVRAVADAQQEAS